MGSATGASRVAPAEITVGRDVGPVGRWVRLVAGVLSLSFGLGVFVAGSGTEMAQTAVAVAGLTAYYVALYRLLGERLLARTHPWFGTTIMLGSLGVFTAPFMPQPLRHGAGLYVGATLILAALIRYGGCEVAALPTLLFRRRYVLYCPWNAIDLAERPLHRLRTNLRTWLAAGITVIVGVYFVLGRDALARFDLPDPIAPGWALLLLAPASLLAYHAGRASKPRDASDAGGNHSEARVLGLGAAVLVLLALHFAELIPHQVDLWTVVMLGGLVYATSQAIRTAIRHRRSDRSESTRPLSTP